MKPSPFRSISSAFLVAASVALLAAAPHALSQSKQSSSERRASSLTGRVVDESGQPIPYANVSISGVNHALDRYRNVSVDEDGRVSFDDLKPGTYKIDVHAGGYHLDGDDQSQTYYRPGDSVALRMIKGGVITGTVTNAAGEPVIAVTATAIRVRDFEGRPARRAQYSNRRMTDDRGVYRLYGLLPGVYVVMAGGLGGSTFAAYQDDTPTYHPSATRDGAAEVTVQTGQEVSGIDIRYRAERGHTVSGSISAPEAKGPSSGVTVHLFESTTSWLVAETYSDGRPGSRSFAFHGVPDGEYYLRARRQANRENNGASSTTLAVKVKGAEVTGLDLALRATGSISGSVELQGLSDDDRKSKCESMRNALVEESLIFARRDKKDDRNVDLPSVEEPVSAPGDKSEFKISDVEPGRYRLEVRPPAEQWYVRSITLPPPDKGKPPVDAARDGLAISSDQQITGLTITLAEGAAKLRGRVVPEKEGAALPEHLRVFLVPAEKDSAHDVLRFFEAPTQSDGAFGLTNVQPGRYWVLAVAADEARFTGGGERPALAWDATFRSKLRSAGEAANNAIEFRACQRVIDHVLSFTPKLDPSPKQNQRERRRK